MPLTRRAVSRLALLFPATALPALAHDYRVADLAIAHPWSRPAIQGGTGAGFMVIRNAGSAPDRLLSAASPAARAVELHTHAQEGGIMRMRPVPDIPIPPGAEARLAPGGLHVMLIGLNRPFRAGDRVPLTLTFERAGTVVVELAVEAGARGGDHAH